MDAKIPYTIGLGLHWQSRLILHDRSIDHHRSNEASKVDNICHSSYLSHLTFRFSNKKTHAYQQNHTYGITQQQMKLKLLQIYVTICHM